MKKTKPYGTWPSPLSAEKVASGTLDLSEVTESGERIYWLERRPNEGGRNVVVELQEDGSTRDMIPDGYNARSRVHEYGGASYLVNEGETYFVNFKDQRLYRVGENNQPQPFTSKKAKRYADFILDGNRERLISVCEDHSGKGEAENYLLEVSLDRSGGERKLIGGHDFYSTPRINPEGTKLSWLTWDHPNMPWDGTSLHVAVFNQEDSVADERVIAGGDSESITAPNWGPHGWLYFISDRTGWWNIYRWKEGDIERVSNREAEFAGPQWVFGLSTYDFLPNGDLGCTYTQNGRWSLGTISVPEMNTDHLDVPYTSISSLSCREDELFFIGGAPDKPDGVRKLDLTTGETVTFKLSTNLEIDDKFISSPVSINFPVEDNHPAHGFFYPPKNGDYEGPNDEKPPLIVTAHGGPTSATRDSLSYQIQYWTTRGFAFLDVNYRGSTGFGREFRNLLYGNWGLFDVEDSSTGAKYLVQQGKVDGDRLIIRGGSAGGYTTLASLTFGETFDAGASYFGVSDPSLLSETTHKFESRYLDNLIAPYPQEKETYVDRSPIDHVDDLSCPVIFLQGSEDKVVPPDQAETMHDSLIERGVSTAYLLFDGEQHGFRNEANIRRALEAEFYFYSQIFDFQIPEEIEPIEIKNL